MHHEYAFEQWAVCQKKVASDAYFLKTFATEPEIMALACSSGDEKIISICETIKSMNGERYRHPTDKQKFAIANSLLQKYSARQVLEIIYGDKIKPYFDEHDNKAS